MEVIIQGKMMVVDLGSAATDFSLDPERNRSSPCLLSVNDMNADVCHLGWSAWQQKNHIFLCNEQSPFCLVHAQITRRTGW